ncbi:MAG: class I SAM-dependent methyltransferase [Sphingobacteriia bacterium]|nr:MAG: class I SAM-dependent methyltransferase [Sphingobacteriia bacterium]
MLPKIVQKIADNKSKDSLSHQLRSKRFLFFQHCIQQLPKPIHILDIGGTMAFWQSMNFNPLDIRITLLNLEPSSSVSYPFECIQADATKLTQFGDQSVDIVFSNSVIEHLFTWENQQKMAQEVQRVGKNYFIQSPNYWFPIEPHWVFPCFQYLPFWVKCWMTQQFALGHIGAIKDAARAREQVAEIKLLSLKEIKQLFPHSAVYKEKFMGLNKSFIAHSFGI